jgi:hypothetical protein
VLEQREHAVADQVRRRSAYDRLHLGWLTPRLLAPGAITVDIPDANDALVAFEVATARPDEYFLLEYRRRPASGYASAAAMPFDGGVVYHVLESSDENTDPPLLRVEAIAGAGAAPATLRTYAGATAFTIDAVRAGPAGSLEADLTVEPLDSARREVPRCRGGEADPRRPRDLVRW